MCFRKFVKKREKMLFPLSSSWWILMGFRHSDTWIGIHMWPHEMLGQSQGLFRGHLSFLNVSAGTSHKSPENSKKVKEFMFKKSLNFCLKVMEFCCLKSVRTLLKWVFIFKNLKGVGRTCFVQFARCTSDPSKAYVQPSLRAILADTISYLASVVVNGGMSPVTNQNATSGGGVTGYVHAWK